MEIVVVSVRAAFRRSFPRVHTELFFRSPTVIYVKETK